MKTFTLIFLILPFLTFQYDIKNNINHVERFTSFFDPRFATEYYKNGISFTESGSPNTITVNVTQLQENLPESTNLLVKNGNVVVKFNITSNDDNVPIKANDYCEIKIAKYTNQKLESLSNNFFTPAQEKNTITFTKNNNDGTKDIIFNIVYVGYTVEEVPYKELFLVNRSQTQPSVKSNIIEFKPQNNKYEYVVDIDVMKLYDSLSETIDENDPLIFFEDNMVKLKFNCTYEHNDPQKEQFEFIIGSFANKAFKFTNYNDDDKYYFTRPIIYNDEDNFKIYRNEVQITFNYKYQNQKTFTFEPRENGNADPFFENIDGKDYTKIGTFDYSSEYKKAGMNFKDNTITVDRLRLLEYIEGENNLTYLIAGDKNNIDKTFYLTFGLQLKGYPNDFHTKYTSITKIKDIDFKKLSEQDDGPQYYKHQQMIYFVVALIKFDDKNKPISVPYIRNRENSLVRYIWKDDTDGAAEKYATCANKITIKIIEEIHNDACNLERRREGSALGLAESNVDAFDYISNYTRAGMTFENNVITVNYNKMQEFANKNEESQQNFLRLCNEYPTDSNPKQYNVYYGLTFKPGDGYTESLRGGYEVTNIEGAEYYDFNQDSFSILAEKDDDSEFFQHMVTRYIKVATFVHNGSYITVHAIPEKEFTYKYIWKKEKTGGGYEYFNTSNTITIKSEEYLRIDSSNINQNIASIDNNNLVVDLNSLLQLDNIDNYFVKSGQKLYLPIPYTGVASGLTAIQEEENMINTIITHVYPFLSPNPDHNVYHSVSHYACVAVKEPYKNGKGEFTFRLHPCERRGYNSERLLLSSETNYQKGKRVYILPQLGVTYKSHCTNDAEGCKTCSEENLKCAVCNENYILDIRTGECKEEGNGIDDSFFETKETNCEESENVCTVNQDFTKEESTTTNIVFYEEQSTMKKIVFESKMPENAYYKAVGKNIKLDKDAVLNILLQSDSEEDKNTIDISELENPTVNLKLLNKQDSKLEISSTKDIKEVQLNTVDNQIQGLLEIIVPSKVNKLGIKDVKLFNNAELTALRSKQSSSVKMLEDEQPVPLEFSTLKVNKGFTSLKGNVNIKEALTIQPEGVLFLLNYETTVENIVYNLEGAEKMPKLITKIPEKAAPKKITINAEQLSNEGTTTIPLVLGTYHFDICTTWKKNSEIKKEGKHNYKVKCVDASSYLNTESAKAFLKKLEEEGKDEIPPNTYVLAVTNDEKLKDALDKDKNKLPAGAIAGIVIACVVVVAAIIGLLVYFLVIKKKQKATSSTQGDSSIAI